MVGVNSNKEVAGQLATGLFNALDTLNAATSVSEDGQTTVAGNASAKEAIASAQAAVLQVSSSIGNAAANLQSVASEFAAADDHLKNSVFGQLPKPNSGGR
ncbi:TIGR04197 family type VII secretion effector [Enterococcus sp. BWM-S5]|uniref:TIGR04197 family type VII secretion effector n=1 Tax=Enterococcus larvae TaxID=2794352 RepID=A0ABS4CL43_9ENTE|nr:TIGR04197 family type VII secretion effector [Enterococcus larvae]MBP1047324.1 TIGR04197 family type VII secretion effector [Enterococcus larvae]